MITDYIGDILDSFGDSGTAPRERYSRARLDAYMQHY